MYHLVVCNGALAVESNCWSSFTFLSVSGTVPNRIVLGTIVGRFSSGCTGQILVLFSLVRTLSIQNEIKLT